MISMLNSLVRLVVFFLLDLECITANLNCVLLNELSNYDLINEHAMHGPNRLQNDSATWQSSNFSHPINPENSTIVPLSFWEMDPLFSKCGILPAELVNNHKSNAKFFIHWLFNSHSSFKLSFRLEFIEDYTYLNYYFSIRKFTTNEEFLTKIHRFHETNDSNSSHGQNDDDDNEATIEESLEFANDIEKRMLYSYFISKSFGRNTLTGNLSNITIARHEAYNNLIVSFKPLSAYHEKYDMLNQMYIICVMLINLRNGATFTLPFMCLDIYTDRRYYKVMVKIKSQIESYEFFFFFLIELWASL